MRYLINYKAENSIPRLVAGDRMKVDGTTAIILKLEGDDKYRVVAVINMEAIKEIVEEVP